MKILKSTIALAGILFGTLTYAESETHSDIEGIDLSEEYADNDIQNILDKVDDPETKDFVQSILEHCNAVISCEKYVYKEAKSQNEVASRECEIIHAPCGFDFVLNERKEN